MTLLFTLGLIGLVLIIFCGLYQLAWRLDNGYGNYGGKEK